MALGPVDLLAEAESVCSFSVRLAPVDDLPVLLS